MIPLRQTIAAVWIAVTSLTIAHINAILGTVSLIVGISYQIWKWRRESRRTAREERPLD